MNKKLVVLILVFIFAFVSLYSQGTKKDEQEDKFSTMNVMLTQIIDTPKGVIVEYYAKDEIQYTYIPNKFFEESIAVRVWENDTSISPQANVVFKNGEQFKVKIYMPKNTSSLVYRMKDFLNEKEKEAFNTKELKFTF